MEETFAIIDVVIFRDGSNFMGNRTSQHSTLFDLKSCHPPQIAVTLHKVLKSGIAAAAGVGASKINN